MSVTRFVPYAEPEFPWHSGIEEREDGDYVMHSDYAALEARCAEMEYALVEISNLPDCDSYMCRQIARDALADTTTGEAQP